MEQENLFLWHALCMGVSISFLYDILRVCRRLFPHGIFWISAEDLIFWIYCAAEVFLLMNREGDGNLRWFAVMGAMFGMGVYLKLVSPLFVKYSVKILSPVVRTLQNWRKRLSGGIRRHVKKRLTAFRGMIKIILQKFRKRGAEDGEPKKTGLGGRFKKTPKGEDVPPEKYI